MREALFGGTDRLVAHLSEHIAGAPADASPCPTLLAALTASGRLFPEDRALARKRQQVIAADLELREREVLKLATLRDLLRDLLAARGIPPHQAVHLVRLALTVYEQAFTRWIAPGSDAAFGTCMSHAAADLDRALSCAADRVSWRDDRTDAVQGH